MIHMHDIPHYYNFNELLEEALKLVSESSADEQTKNSWRCKLLDSDIEDDYFRLLTVYSIVKIDIMEYELKHLKCFVAPPYIPYRHHPVPFIDEQEDNEAYYLRKQIASFNKCDICGGLSSDNNPVAQIILFPRGLDGPLVTMNYCNICYKKRSSLIKELQTNITMEDDSNGND